MHQISDTYSFPVSILYALNRESGIGFIDVGKRKDGWLIKFYPSRMNKFKWYSFWIERVEYLAWRTADNEIILLNTSDAYYDAMHLNSYKVTGDSIFIKT